MGPEALISKMKAINSHVGSWAPLAEQKATARFLENENAVDEFLNYFKGEVNYRLINLYQGFKQLQSEGFTVDAIEPEAAIYLTVKIDLKGKTTQEGLLIEKQEQVTEYVLNKAKLALVPFGYFGADKESCWYRISVGCCKKEEIVDVISCLREALKQLS
jgi:aspartate aminotransferase